jgi:hypothetical protein
MIFPISTYIYAALFALAVAGFGYGRYQHNALVEYKAEIKAVAEKQEAHIESITKQQLLVTKGIEKEYDAKLTLLRNYYANGVRNTSSGSMPANGTTTFPIDAVTTYNLLAGQCAETTQQLISLQEWLNQQIGIK